MTTQQKIQLYMEDMARLGINHHFSYPFLFWLLGKFGFFMRPPFFKSFWQNMFIWGMPFALVWGVLVYIWENWQGRVIHFSVIVLFSVMSGSVYGLVMAIRYSNQAKKLSLPNWDNYYPQKNIEPNT